MRREPVTILHAGAIRDAAGRAARPGAVAVRRGRVVFAGDPDDLPRRLRKKARTLHRPELLVLPGLVNAHTHLDLTDTGPLEFGGDFVAWLRAVIDLRPTDPHAVAAAVHRGLARSRAAGVAYLADIAGSSAAIAARQRAPAASAVPGVSYLECFGLGDAEAVIDRVDAELDALPFESRVPGFDRGVVLGLQPHAPYSAGRALYREANALSHEDIYRLSSHVAESREELELVRDAAGPLAELLRDLGKGADPIQPTHQHPIDWLEPVLRRGRWLLAHCNYVDDPHIEILQRTGTSVAYCPIASDYFGHTNHRYRDMLHAGVNVCLGTDSALCHPPDAADEPLSVLAQMRYLYRRDGTDPELLLKMATTHGAVALEFRAHEVTFDRGVPAAFTAVPIDPDDSTDPLVQALAGDAPPAPLWLTGGAAAEPATETYA